MKEKIIIKALPYLFALGGLIVLAIVISPLILQPVAERTIKSVAEGIGTAFAPRINIRAIIFGKTESDQREHKIVVHSARVNVVLHITADEAITFWPDHHAEVTVAYLGNRVQYIIDTDALFLGEYSYCFKSNTLYAKIPTPVVDMDIVEVQTNPDSIIVITEGRMGNDEEFLLESLKRLVRAHVLIEGNKKSLIREASRSAEIVVQGLLEDAYDLIDVDVEVVVMVEDEFSYPDSVMADELHHF